MQLTPPLPLHRALLDAAPHAFWSHYRDRHASQRAPSAATAAHLRDRLSAT